MLVGIIDQSGGNGGGTLLFVRRVTFLPQYTVSLGGDQENAAEKFGVGHRFTALCDLGHHILALCVAEILGSEAVSCAERALHHCLENVVRFHAVKTVDGEGDADPLIRRFGRIHDEFMRLQRALENNVTRSQRIGGSLDKIRAIARDKIIDLQHVVCVHHARALRRMLQRITATNVTELAYPQCHSYHPTASIAVYGRICNTYSQKCNNKWYFFLLYYKKDDRYTERVVHYDVNTEMR